MIQRELDVVDYLLKPVALPRFLQAINKVIERKGSDAPNKSIVYPAEQLLLTEKAEEDSIIVKSGYKLYKINYSDYYI